jgi:hypothetical protein
MEAELVKHLLARLIGSRISGNRIKWKQTNRSRVIGSRITGEEE